MSEHFVGKVTQKALIFQDGKVLLNRDVGSETYDLPGGRIDFGEEPIAALKREIREELGIEIEVGKAFFFCLTDWGTAKTPHYFVVFEALLSPAEQVMKVDGTEVEEARWITHEELATVTLHPECVRAIELFFSGT